MKATFPSDAPDAALILSDAEAESNMELIISIITGIRNIRGEMNISPSLELNAVIQSGDEAVRKTVQEHQNIIVNLARIASLSVQPPGEKPKAAATAVADAVTIFVPLEGIIDFDREIERLEKEVLKITNELTATSKKLSNEDFLSKAPDDVVVKVREKHELLIEKRQKLQSNLNRIKGIDH